MAGIVGGREVSVTWLFGTGIHRYQMDVMIATVVVLIVLVQIVQSIGDYSAQKADKA